jgi:hypothetical protein
MRGGCNEWQSKVDGFKCGSKYKHLGQNNSARKSTVTTSATTQRPLIFAPLQLTGTYSFKWISIEHSLEDDTIDVTSGKVIGEISLSIWRVNLTRECQKWEASAHSPTGEGAWAVEKSFCPPCGACLVRHHSNNLFTDRCHSHNSFGKEQSTKPVYHQSTQKLHRHPVVTFPFLYRPLGENQ